MNETVEIRFTIDGNPTPWEVEAVRHPAQGQVPTAVRRITELRQQYPAAAISTERRGDVRQPKPVEKFRYSIYVKSGTMLVNDPQGVNGVRVTPLEKETLFSRPFTENEREHVRAEIFKLFPEAQLTEMRG